MTKVLDSGPAAALDFASPAADGPMQKERIVKIIISKIVPDKFRVDDNNAILIQIDGGSKEYEGLRIRFQFRRPLVWTPSIGTVEIYNLAPDTRALLGETNARVIIQAGYRSTGLKQLGIISTAQMLSRRSGPDWITKIEGGDGGRQHWNARINQGFAGKTNVIDIFKSMAGKSGLKLGAQTLASASQAMSGMQKKQGASYNGKVMDELRAVCKQAGLDIFIAHETIYVVPPDGNVGQLQVVGPDSGLIGSPEYAAAPHPGKPKLIKWKMLLKPEMLQGSPVKLDAEFHKGIYRARELNHTGDTWDLPWYTDVEAQAQKQVF